MKELKRKPKKIILKRRLMSESFSGFDKSGRYSIAIDYNYVDNFWSLVIGKNTKRLGWNIISRDQFGTIEQALEALRDFAENPNEPYNKTFEIIFENDEKSEIRKSKHHIVLKNFKVIPIN